MLPNPLEEIARTLDDYNRRLSHLERLEEGGNPDIGARVYNDADILIPNNVETALTFNQERYDTDTIHDLVINTERLTARTAGKYCISFNGVFAADGVGDRRVAIRLNGATPITAERWEVESAFTNFFSISTIWAMAIGDFVEATVFQRSGGNLNILTISSTSPEFMMQMLAAT